jgi:UDP-N-acetyl-D-glucosamine dehydrogenase
MGGDVRACDPHVEPADNLVELTTEELQQADLVVVLTDHDRFPFDLVAEHAPHVLDCRRVPQLRGAETL